MPVDVSVIADGFEANGMPRAVAEAFASSDTAIAQGYFAVQSDTARDMLGREPMSMREFLTAHRTELVEGAPAADG